MSHLLTAGAALLLVLAPAPESTTSPGASAADDDATAFKGTKKTSKGNVAVYDFENDHVSGQLLSPEGADINSRQTAVFKSLIKIRGTFTPELIKLARDV